MHTLINEDKKLIADEEQRRQREKEEEAERLARARDMRRRASMDKVAKEAIEKAAFEAKIAARRNEIAAKAK